MVHRYHICIAALLCALLGLLVLPPAGALSSAPPYQTCSNVILNGGFETSGNWTLGPGPLPPMYVNSPVYSGSWAMQTGSPGPTNALANSWIYQRITIPNNAVSADLNFWTWLTSAPNAGTDVQQALLLIPGSNNLNQPFQVLWSTQTNAPAWQKISASLINQKGRTLDLYFNVFNDGTGGNTSMVLDNVTLTICQPSSTPTVLPSVTPWPTPVPTSLPSATPFPTPLPVSSVTASPIPSTTAFPTPAGSATPLPPNCVDIIGNGGFEWDGDWAFGWDPLLPFYNNNAAFVHSGARSMAQGAVNQSPVTTPAFSSIRQNIVVPPDAFSANITFWYYPISNAAAGGFNRQELILLDPLAFDETVAVLWRVTENSQSWQTRTYDLSQYRGRTLSVYFNARNSGDGTWTGMYLDDVSVVVCDSAVAVQLPAVIPPIATPAPDSGIDSLQPGQPNDVATTGATVISVSPVPSSEGSPSTAPTASSNTGSDEPRRERQPLSFSDLSPAAVLGLVSFLVILVVVGIVLLRRRKEGEEHASQSTPIDGTPDG
ncbi:MAG TPA: hypothetical protein P5148_03000 [Anaerolineae bacterium]|nr:hypothetical protein [Anaerolineae bacterium]